MYLEVIVSAVCALAGAFGGGSLLFIKQNKQLKQAEVDLQKINVVSKTSDEWQEIAEEERQKVHELNDKVDKLYTDLHEQQDQNRRLKQQINNLLIFVHSIEHNYCSRNACTDRMPAKTPTIEDIQKELEQVGIIK